MGESFSAVSSAVNKLLPLLIDEAVLLWSVHDEFAAIKDELESIQSFLKDADRRAEGDNDNSSEGVKTWVKQVGEVAFRIEDVVDDYMIHVGEESHDPGRASILCEIFHMIKTCISRHQIVSEIRNIKSCVRRINERSGTYGFQAQLSSERGSGSSRGSKNVNWYDPRTAALFMDEAEVVGFDAPRAELIDWFEKGTTERTVISLVGMGGQGKTTLAKNVFDKVKGHFGCYAWITVSQNYTVEGLLKDMLLQFWEVKEESPPQGFHQMDRNSLITTARNYLHGSKVKEDQSPQKKRYIVVFDDVWNIHFWDDIQLALIDNEDRSRIFITTRNKDVAMSCNKSSHIKVHELQSLTQEKSKELFYKTAFRFDFNGHCPGELIDISSEIVKKCNGFPLAIVAIGGFLSTKEKTAFEWTKFSQNLNSELHKDSHLIGITKILGFSYDDLPYHLKSCLLYFGIYPEDYEVDSKRLIYQWIAEGFVKEERGKTLKEVGEGYLTQLIHRNLVQVASTSVDGKAEYCKVHDLIHEMILKKFENLSFCKFIDRSEPASSGAGRRLSIATTSKDLKASIRSPHVRSLFFFTKEELPKNLVNKISKKYKKLKVLDFESTTLDCAPGKLGNFIHLRYLSFNNTKVKSLPKGIGKLQNLETLDLWGTNVKVLPKEINKLKKLKHLLGHGMLLTQLENDIGGLISLQTLDSVEIDANGAKLLRELRKLRMLRELGFTKIRGEHGRTLCSSISEMNDLEKLHITFEGTIDLQFISPLCMLLDLDMCGMTKNFLSWVPNLQNLVKLSLESSQLIDDLLGSLQNLPNLLDLQLISHSYVGQILHFQDGGFKKLKQLRLVQLHPLSSIVIDKGALLSLQLLKLMYLPELKTIPSGIQHLLKLEVLQIHFMPTEFNKSIAPDEGPEHPSIKHIPLVEIRIYSPDEGHKVKHIYH